MKHRQKYFRFINTFFVVLPTTFVISIVTHLMKGTFIENRIDLFFKSWLLLLPIAYLCVLLLLPLADKITNRILK
ncbi:DUF2798 domain-containing protein [Sphingobacterium pedocola]|uniref:DUF2798 domain-containing protein n=1 Tax=Sphingobacterium pedocola TaxID=2082722 RepID=A0ABR9T8C0_9SPHI|nr:DUF2798 domain-containing protein [Sphingobacterium pedocola]